MLVYLEKEFKDNSMFQTEADQSAYEAKQLLQEIGEEENEGNQFKFVPSHPSLINSHINMDTDDEEEYKDQVYEQKKDQRPFSAAISPKPVEIGQGVRPQTANQYSNYKKQVLKSGKRPATGLTRVSSSTLPETYTAGYRQYSSGGTQMSHSKSVYKMDPHYVPVVNLKQAYHAKTM